MPSSTNASATALEACDFTRLPYTSSVESNRIREIEATGTSNTSPSPRDPGSDSLIPDDSKATATLATDSEDRGISETDSRCERSLSTQLDYSIARWLAQHPTEDPWTLIILPQTDDLDSEEAWMDWQFFDTPTQSTDSQCDVTDIFFNCINVGVNCESNFGPDGDS